MQEAANSKWLKIGRAGDSGHRLLVCLALAAVTAVVYWQALKFEFTNFDEFSMVLNNPYVLSGLTPSGLWWALTTSWFEYWHPLTWLSHMLDCELFGLNAGGHHLMSVALHIANTLLVYIVLERMTGAWRRSALVAALFALHPLHVESVAWVAERKDVLSAFFFLLTLWAYAGYVQSLSTLRSAATEDGKSKAQSPRHPSSVVALRRVDASRFYLLSLLSFACGLMSKPMVVTLPFVLLLLDFWPLRRLDGGGSVAASPLSAVSEGAGLAGMRALPLLWKRLLLEKVPFFALTAVSCVITYTGVRAGGSVLSAEAVPWGLRLVNVPVSYVRYIIKLFVPTGLIPFYPMPDHWAGWQVVGSVVILGLISLYAFARWRSAPYLLVGWLFFLGIMVPTVGFVPVGYQSIADRYTYVPAIGVFVALVWGVAQGFGKHRLPGAAMAGSVLLLCGAMSWVQVGTWRNSVELWTHCLSVCPDNIFARYNLGYALQHSAKSAEAMEQYRATLRLKPNHTDANLNLGIALIEKGRCQEATNYLGAAIRSKPGYSRAQGAMGLALLSLGDYDGAVRCCGEAIRLDPEAFGPYVDMGRALSAQGKSDDALRYYAEGLRLNPRLAQTHYYLGLEWMKRGDFGQAVLSLQEAVRLAPTWQAAKEQLEKAQAGRR